MSNDLISVVIPTFNREKLVTRSIKSVLNQTLKNIEVVVVDDGSTDNTENAIKKIKDKRIKYYKLKKNSGACYARNFGISKSKGKYIAFQDSDDVFHKDKLEKQLKNLLLNDSDLDFCRICLKFMNDFLVPTDSQIKGFTEGGYISELCRGNFISTQTILAKKSVFEDISFDNSLPRFQDYDLILRIMTKYKMSYTNKVLVDLYKEDNTIGSSSSKLRKACLIMLKKKYDLEPVQEDLLIDNLAFWLKKDKIDSLDDRYFDLVSEHNELISNYKNLEKAFFKLQNENKSLNFEFNELRSNYNAIVNSKRWKFLVKVMNFFGK